MAAASAQPFVARYYHVLREREQLRPTLGPLRIIMLARSMILFA